MDLSVASVQALASQYAVQDATWMRANMVLTLDGHYLDEHGSSRGLSHPTDLKILLLLRAMSDVVVVGARTAVSEKYVHLNNRPEFSEVTTGTPRLCVISKTLDFSTDASFLGQDEAPCIVLTTAQESSDWVRNAQALESSCELVVLPERLTGAAIRQALHQRGLARITCEGGPQTLNLFMADSSIDELDITLAPIISGRSREQLPLGFSYSQWNSQYVGYADNHQFLRYLKAPRNE